MRTKKYVLIFLIIFLGLFLRIYNIQNTPPGVYPDEAVNGLDALSAIHNGNWQWFYPANNGREGLFMNLIALCFKFFGVSVLTLKLPSIIFGTLVIIGTYLLGKELYNRRIGLISGFLVATAFWAINFSRISFRANMLPAVLAFSLFFLWRGMRTKKIRDFAISGLIFGIGLHTYISFRIAPAVLVGMFFVFLFTRQNFIRQYWKNLLVFAAATFLTAAPMLYTLFVSHPEYWTSRSTSISIMSPEVNQGDLLVTFLRSFGLSLVKYSIWGDQNWRHNYPPYAILDPITGIAFAFGLIYSIIRLFQLLYLRFWKKENHPRMEVYIFLLFWFFIMNAPEFLTAEGNPHALRAIGTLPVTFILASLTFEYFFRASERYSPIFKKISVGILTIILLSVGIFNSIKYHLFWAKNPKTAESFERNLIDISNYLKTQNKNEKIYVFAESMQRVPLQVFNWNQSNVEYVYLAEKESVNPQGEVFQIVLTNHENETIGYLEEKFPFLKMNEIRDELGMTYYVLK